MPVSLSLSPFSTKPFLRGAVVDHESHLLLTTESLARMMILPFVPRCIDHGPGRSFLSDEIFFPNNVFSCVSLYLRLASSSDNRAPPPRAHDLLYPLNFFFPPANCPLSFSPQTATFFVLGPLSRGFASDLPLDFFPSFGIKYIFVDELQESPFF